MLRTPACAPAPKWFSFTFTKTTQRLIDRFRELKRFQRIELKPGESKTVRFTLDRAAFSYWSAEKKGWVADPGTFEIQVGSSSRDIRLRAPLGFKD